MTIGELIEELSQYDKNCEVKIFDYETQNAANTKKNAVNTAFLCIILLSVAEFEPAFPSKKRLRLAYWGEVFLKALLFAHSAV